MQLAIYTYGAGELVGEILNAIASTVKPGSGYSEYISMVMGLAAFMASFQYMKSRKTSDLIRSAVRYALVTSILLLPIAKVQVVDEVVQTKNISVDNVPFGLAVPAYLTTGFFHSLTRLVETAFHMPDDLNYSKSGFLFASRLVNNSYGFQLIDSNQRENLNNFIHQCVFYDIHFGKYTVKDLTNADDIWALISKNPSQIRSFLMNNSVISCKDGATELSKQWAKTIEDSGIRYAKAIFPSISSQQDQVLKNKLLTELGQGYQHLTELSKSGSQIMQQVILMNAIKDGALNDPLLGGISYAQSKGNIQKFVGSVNTGMLVGQWQPILMGVIECLLYASFILVALYSLFGNGEKVILNYFISLAWVASWPVVYAFLHLGATFAIRQTSHGYTISISDLAHLNQTNYYLSALFGYTTLTVPYFSWQLINLGKQGLGAALMQLSQLVGGATQSVAMGAAAESTSGNFNFGNTSLGNHSANNVSAFKHDTNSSYANGAASVTSPDGSVLTQFPGGNTVLNQTPGLSQLNTQVHLADSLRTSASEQADSAYSTALTEAQNYGTNLDTAVRNMMDFGSHLNAGASSGTSYGTTESASMGDSLQKMYQDVHRFAQNHNISDDAARRFLVGAYVNGNATASWGTDKQLIGRAAEAIFGASGGINATIGGKGEADLTSSHLNSQSLSELQDSGELDSFYKNLDNSIRAFSENTYRTNTDEGQRLAESISTSLGEVKHSSESISSNYQTSESYRNLASYSQDNSASIDRNATHDFKDWLANQSLEPGMGRMGDYQADALLRNNAQLSQSYAQQYVQQATSAKMQEWKSQNINAGSVQDSYSSSKSSFSADIQSDYANSISTVKSAAIESGITNKAVDTSALSDANQLLDSIEKSTALEGKSVKSNFSSREDRFNEK